MTPKKPQVEVEDSQEGMPLSDVFDPLVMGQLIDEAMTHGKLKSAKALSNRLADKWGVRSAPDRPLSHATINYWRRGAGRVTRMRLDAFIAIMIECHPKGMLEDFLWQSMTAKAQNRWNELRDGEHLPRRDAL